MPPWFTDLRRPHNVSRPLESWYTPAGLTALLKRDEAAAEQKLTHEEFHYGFPLRPYQKDAIRAIEGGIATGRRSLLLAMATGTGKTSLHDRPRLTRPRGPGVSLWQRQASAMTA